ncbi:hypothetical protein LINPERHAP1_LOCUS17317 [Linum perenne]
MVVNRQAKGRNQKAVQAKQVKASTSSRFAVLTESDEEVDEEIMADEIPTPTPVKIADNEVVVLAAALSQASHLHDGATWDVDRLSAVLPSDALSAVVGMPTPREDCGEDEWIWGEWLRQNLKSDSEFIFGVQCWMLWRARNERLFAYGRTSASYVAFRSVNWARQVTLASKREEISLGKEVRKYSLDVRWEPGPEGWVILNSDGSVNQQTRRAATGGVLRNS